MKTQSPQLAAHRLGTTTLAFCWKVTRRDGQVFAYTNLDRDIVFDGVTYLAADGFNASKIEGAADLSVSNLELVGPLATASINDADVLAGRWDDAEVEVFEVNYRDLTMGRMIVSAGTLGNISTGQTEFQAEQRGVEQKLQQPVGRVYAALCDAVLGDARCGIDLEALAVSGTVTSVSSRRAFVDSALAQAADYFGAGFLEFTSGANDGLRMEIQTFASGGAFSLALNMPYAIAVGDTFIARPGCRKRRTEDCRDKFSNVIRFRGFPDIPGNNKVLGNAGLASA